MKKTWQEVYAEWLRYHNWACENRLQLEADGTMPGHVKKMQALWKRAVRLKK